MDCRIHARLALGGATLGGKRLISVFQGNMILGLGVPVVNARGFYAGRWYYLPEGEPVGRTAAYVRDTQPEIADAIESVREF